MLAEAKVQHQREIARNRRSPPAVGDEPMGPKKRRSFIHSDIERQPSSDRGSVGLTRLFAVGTGPDTSDGRVLLSSVEARTFSTQSSRFGRRSACPWTISFWARRMSSPTRRVLTCTDADAFRSRDLASAKADRVWMPPVLPRIFLTRFSASIGRVSGPGCDLRHGADMQFEEQGPHWFRELCARAPGLVFLVLNIGVLAA